jgi:medium-chain acyl-[acyl-carrier-protein] hydrolase
MRVFCFPYAGGGAAVFRAWPDDLPEEVEVCAIALPGRGARLREAPFNRLAPLVAVLSAAIVPYLDRPFAFFGHSMGALMGFEVARDLRRRGDFKPSHMFVSGYRAPQLGFLGTPIHALSDDAFIEELRRLNGTAHEILESDELMRLLLPMLKADFAMCEGYLYTPDAPLDCAISAYGGRDDGEVSAEDLRAWRAQTSGPFTVQMFPGDHFFLESARRELLRAVGGELGRILGRACNASSHAAISLDDCPSTT